MRELVDKQLMLEDVKSWVAMDSYEQHLINNMLAWIENLPTVEVSDEDCISRRVAIDAVRKNTFRLSFAEEQNCECHVAWSAEAVYSDVMEGALLELPATQPELTDEQSIAHLQSSGWMQRHDKEMYESGLKEQLADDSDSYDSLLPTVQPERIWHSCKTPPKHHKDVLVRGTESIGNVTIYKVMQWDVDAWRPTNYAPSIIWEEWSEI